MKPPSVALLLESLDCGGFPLLKDAAEKAAGEAGWSIFSAGDELPPEVTHVVYLSSRTVIRAGVTPTWDLLTARAECPFGKVSLASGPRDIVLSAVADVGSDPLAAGLCAPYPAGFVRQHFEPSPEAGPCTDFSSTDSRATFTAALEKWMLHKVGGCLPPPDRRPDTPLTIVVPFFGRNPSKSESLRFLVRCLDHHWTGRYGVVFSGDLYPFPFVSDPDRSGHLNAGDFVDMLWKLARWDRPFLMMSTCGLPCGPLNTDDSNQLNFLKRVPCSSDLGSRWSDLLKHAGEESRATGQAAEALTKASFQGSLLRPWPGSPLWVEPDRLGRLLEEFPDVSAATFPMIYANTCGQALLSRDRVLVRGAGAHNAVKLSGEIWISKGEKPDPVLRRHLVLGYYAPSRLERKS